MSGADAMEVLEHMEPMAEKPLVLAVVLNGHAGV